MSIATLLGSALCPNKTGTGLVMETRFILTTMDLEPKTFDLSLLLPSKSCGTSTTHPTKSVKMVFMEPTLRRDSKSPLLKVSLLDQPAASPSKIGKLTMNTTKPNLLPLNLTKPTRLLKRDKETPALLLDQRMEHAKLKTVAWEELTEGTAPALVTCSVVLLEPKPQEFPTAPTLLESTSSKNSKDTSQTFTMTLWELRLLDMDTPAMFTIATS
mmetsp:Transcript_22821/g.31795  ORF Transcript_22821/g.31795 Transcript_22821/m.31795 type:complete len:214 (+) Transcript_22821:446-1087(+)